MTAALRDRALSIEPELLVLTSEAMPEIGLAQPTVTPVMFEEEGEGTRVTITQAPHTDEMLSRASAGWRRCLDKLESLLVGDRSRTAPDTPPA